MLWFSESADWSKLSGTVYSGASELTKLATTIYSQFAWSNPLHPAVFPSVRQMESEVVRMCCTMFNGDSDTCGSVKTWRHILYNGHIICFSDDFWWHWEYSYGLQSVQGLRHFQRCQETCDVSWFFFRILDTMRDHVSFISVAPSTAHAAFDKVSSTFFMHGRARFSLLSKRLGR